MKRLVKRDEWGHPIQEWNSDELLDSVECQVRRVRRWRRRAGQRYQRRPGVEAIRFSAESA